MADTELREKIVLTGADEAVAKLGKLAGVAGSVAKSLSGITAMGAAVAGIAGAWQIVETIHETDKLYQSIGRVKAITGTAAENAHAMFDMFELSGIEMTDAESIMTRLAKLSGKLGEGVAGTAKSAQQSAHWMKALGISVKAGPQERLMQMAAAAQKGKLGIFDLVKAFNIPQNQAAQMLRMLQQGPERLRQIAQDTLESSDLIDERALEAHQRMLDARREMGDAWGGLVGTLYKSLIPGATVMIKLIKSGFDSINPIVESIGSGLAGHMGLVVSLTKTYVALLAGAKIANKFGGKDNDALGIIDRAKQLYGMANGFLTPSRIGRKFSPGGGVKQIFGVAGMGGFEGGSAIVRILGSSIGRLGVIGVVVGGVIAAFNMLKNNTMGIRDSLVRTFGSIWARLQSIFGKLVDMLSPLFDAFSAIASVVGGAFLITLQALAGALDGLLWAIDKVVSMVKGLFGGIFTSGPIADMLRKRGINIGGDSSTAAAATVNGVKTPDGKPPTTYQDFRGSKFEIQNNFPSNVDGGRVAAAFGDTLTRLGERRIDAGTRPLYSYR